MKRPPVLIIHKLNIHPIDKTGDLRPRVNGEGTANRIITLATGFLAHIESCEVTMKLRAPHPGLFIISGCLAMVGVLSGLPISLPIPGRTEDNAALYIFAAWFFLAVGSVETTEAPDSKVQSGVQAAP